MLTKVCSRCGIEKPLEDFSPAATGRLGRVSACRPCIAAQARVAYREDPQKFRDASRETARRRRANPITKAHINQRRRDLYDDDAKEQQRVYLAGLRERHFFQWRARLWSSRHKERVTAEALLRLWWRQRGRCTLSGRKLDRTAHLDHTIPISKGGAHGIENLRWLDPVVNVARQNLSDVEFIALCRSICEYQLP